MGYICPTCSKEFNSEENVTKHFLACWKETHPFHQSKSAPTKEVVTRKVNNDIVNFFNSLQ